jgi:prepilin-type N-terminal cleavage/methylation domain-containing protein
MHRRTRQLPRAFTLVEILVVVVILGIASAVILPQLGSRDDVRAKSAARMVMADFIYAQNLAIARQSPRYVVFTPSGYSIRESPSGSPINHPIDKTPFIVTFNEKQLKDITMTGWNFGGPSTLGFDELGAPFSYDVSATPADALLNSRGSIVITSGSYSLTVFIEPFTGEATVE